MEGAEVRCNERAPGAAAEAAAGGGGGGACAGGAAGVAAPPPNRRPTQTRPAVRNRSVTGRAEHSDCR